MLLCDSLSEESPLEEQVHESEQLVFVHDSVRIVHVSEPLASLLGYRIDEMEGHLMLNFLSVSAFVTLIQTVSKNRLLSLVGKTKEFEPRPTKLKTKTGEEVVLQALCSIDVAAEGSARSKLRLTVVESV